MRIDNWIDVHSHFFLPMSDAEKDGLVKVLQENCWCIDHVDDWTPEKTLDYMDRTGIQMQILSFVPSNLEVLRQSNDYGAGLARKYPDRFGFLTALPTDDPTACLAEIARSDDELHADGFAVLALYNGVYLSDPSLEPVWAELNRRQAVVFAHSNAFGSSWGRPAALMDVAFQTAHVITDMLYKAVFRRYPNIRFILSHCGGALPALSGRLFVLGTESWVPNPNGITQDEMRDVLSRLFLDTAATMPSGLGAALTMTDPANILYGSDCGVPGATEGSMARNVEALLAYKGLPPEQLQAIGRNALALFPAAQARIAAALA